MVPLLGWIKRVRGEEFRTAPTGDQQVSRPLTIAFNFPPVRIIPPVACHSCFFCLSNITVPHPVRSGHYSNQGQPVVAVEASQNVVEAVIFFQTPYFLLALFLFLFLFLLLSRDLFKFLMNRLFTHSNLQTKEITCALLC